MHCRYLPLFFALLGFACTSEDVSEDFGEAPPQYSPVFDYLHKKHLQGSTFSPDESQVLHMTRESGGQVLYSAPTGGETASKIGHYNGDLSTYSYFPNSFRILIGVTATGEGGDRLFVRSPKAELQDLTPKRGSRLQFYAWKADGSAFFYGSNRDVPEYMYLYSMSVNDLTPVLNLQTQDVQFAASSPDDRYLALVKPVPGFLSEMFYYDREAKKLRRQTPLGGGQLMAPQYFEPDGRSCIYLSDIESGIIRPWRHFVDEERSEPLFADWQLNSILYARLSAGGSYLIVGESMGERLPPQPRILDAASGTPVELAGFENLNWDILDISKSERWMTYEIRDKGEDNMYLYDFETGAHRQLLGPGVEARVYTTNVHVD